MKALVGAFNQEKALVGAFSVIVQLVVEPMDRFTALFRQNTNKEEHKVFIRACKPGLVQGADHRW